MSQINKSSEYFNTVLYTGNGGTQSVTGVNFQPDFVWYKARNNASSHGLFDSVRGADKFLSSNLTIAEITQSGVSSFDSDGFSLGSDSGGNGSGNTFVAWNWKANGTASSNTDGSITSSVSANTTAGFSIVSYTGTLANDTVGHGLGVAPKIVIVKNRTGANTDWQVYHSSIGNTKSIQLNSTSAPSTSSNFWNNTSPTSSVFSLGGATDNNGSGDNLIAYCFAEKKGYSKFGSYVGNGSTDGTFIYTGFKPAWIMFKKTTSVGQWYIYDNKRGQNELDEHLYPNLSSAEATGDNAIDILSNGFKMRSNNGDSNYSGSTYIYMAFAENPLVGTNGLPATAK